MTSYIHPVYLVLFQIFFNIDFVISSSIQCKDERGNFVDWFVVYKLPKISHASPSINNGTAYMFITSETVQDGWTLATNKITSLQSLVARTLKPFFQNSNNSLWITYNDQDGLQAGTNYGHTKGVIGASNNGGLWLIHSVPKFPSITQANNTYSFPSTGLKNGQSMLCVSLPADQVDLLGTILMYNKPKVMVKKMDNVMKTLYPNLVSAANGTTIKSAPWKLHSNIFSTQRKQFSNFAKATKFNKDLYEWVAKNLRTDILAETWQNEIDPLPSTCKTKYHVLNVEMITFRNQSVIFSSSKDHSKWAISQSSSRPWVCIGDINRAVPQERRGGGTMCLENPELWRAYRNIVTETSNCKKRLNNKNKKLQ